MSEKIKLSAYLVNNGYFPTRSKATNAIKERKVCVNGRIVTKDGFPVTENDEITVKSEENDFVSRGGLKLREALTVFKIDLKGKTVLDIGASTGGFTDCCLQNGAARVYAYDVGHDQLDEKLKNDSRVIAKEGINCRYLKKEDFNEIIDFICMDVSFISCELMFDTISDILSQEGECVVLFKPQFEVGLQHIGKNGIVTDKTAITEKLADCQKKADNLKLLMKGMIPSPIKGKEGNQEYLLYFVKKDKDSGKEENK